MDNGHRRCPSAPIRLRERGLASSEGVEGGRASLGGRASEQPVDDVVMPDNPDDVASLSSRGNPALSLRFRAPWSAPRDAEPTTPARMVTMLFHVLGQMGEVPR
jgi:hypothetical protein